MVYMDPPRGHNQSVHVYDVSKRNVHIIGNKIIQESSWKNNSFAYLIGVLFPIIQIISVIRWRW